jgi:hypothetical protein
MLTESQAKPSCPCAICRLAAWFQVRSKRLALAAARQVAHVQPIPASLLIAHIPDGSGRHWTAITRIWRKGEARHCRLCPRDKCMVRPDEGVCLVVGPQFVPESECAMHAYGSAAERGLI